MRRAATLLVLLLTTTSSADDHDDRFAVAMKRGADRMVASDAKGAVEAYRAAVAIREDAQAYSELSWAAVVAGDPDAAKTAAQRSIDLADPERPPGRMTASASYYNLRRAFEATRDRDGARAAYQRAVELHFTDEGAARLTKAGGYQLARRDFLGPGMSFNRFCSGPCTMVPSGNTALVMLDDDIQRNHLDHSFPFSLGLQWNGAWYVLPDVGHVVRLSNDIANANYSVSPHEVHVSNGRFLVRWDAGLGMTSRSTHRAVLACGMNGDRISCYGPIFIERTDLVTHGDRPEELTIEYSCDVDFTNDVLTISETKASGEGASRDRIVHRAPPHACQRLPWYGRQTLTF